MEFTIRNMMEQDKQEVLDMMRVFYASPAVQSNGSDEIFENDIRTCIEGSPYLEAVSYTHLGVSYEEVVRQTTENAKKLYRLEK